MSFLIYETIKCGGSINAYRRIVDNDCGEYVVHVEIKAK